MPPVSGPSGRVQTADRALTSPDTRTAKPAGTGRQVSLAPPASTGLVRTGPTPAAGQGIPESSAGNRTPFDALWLDKDSALQAVLEEEGSGGDDVCLVQHPDDLARDSLTVRSHLTDSGILCREPGRLFEHDRPLCLVLDCRRLSGAELTSWNDLLDVHGPCLYDRISARRRPLGPHVRLRVLLAKHQAGTEGLTDDVPGMDFWRRLSRPGLTWERPDHKEQGKDNSDWLPPLAGTLSPAEQAAAEVIDFSLQGDWRRRLYGHPGVDAQGRIRYCPGALEQLRTRPEGTAVLLLGADWSDALFCHEWRKIQDSGRFESNGRQQRLPGGLLFFRSELDAAARHRLGACISRQFRPSADAVVINQHNLAHWLALGRILPDGRWQQADPLGERLARGADLIISSSLEETDWRRLLGRLRAAGRGEGGIGVFLAYDPSDDPDVVPQLAQACQPIFLMEDGAPPLPAGSQGIGIRCWQDADQIAAFLATQTQGDATRTPLMIRVHPGTRLGDLFDNLHVLSDRRPLFGLEKTALEQALSEGRPVLVRGLETHPELQWQLESLLCDPPSLLLHGRERVFPRAQLTLLWPEGCDSPSPLWRQALARAQPLPAVDLWDGVCRRWNLDEAQGQQLRQRVEAFLTAWRSVPDALASQSGPVPHLTAGLLDKLVAAARQRARAEGCTTLAPHHWRRALDSVPGHRSRGCPAVRQFLKVVSARLLPDPGAGDWVDPQRLAELMTDQTAPGQLDQAFFTTQLWPLLRALGPGILPDLPLTFDAACRPCDLKILVAVCRVHGPDSCQHLPVQEGLEPEQTLVQQIRHWPRRSRAGLRRLEDALTAGWRWRGPQDEGPQTLYPALVQLACASYETRGEQGLAPLQGRLERLLQWTGAPERKDAATRALAQDLLTGRQDQADREKRRLTRLRARLEHTPLLIIEGRTATGKSHCAARVAREAGTAFVISLGASTTQEDLVERWVWQEQGAERTMVACHQVILQWAATRPGADGRLVTLVIDEANLAAKGVLDGLKGLMECAPCVYVRGEAVPVSRWHRVILTCNPSPYSGRQQDPDFDREASVVHYPPLDDDFLREQVVGPALDAHLARWIEPVLLKDTAARLVQLWQACRPLLPQREFTPRDLVDLCAWLGCYALRARQQGITLSPAGLNTLVLQAMPDVLDGECDSESRFRLQALESFYAARWPQDPVMQAACKAQGASLDRAFVRHAARVAPDFDTAPAAVMALASAINRDLERCRLAARGALAGGRRQATLIEGPSGRGKDRALQLLLASWQEQCRTTGEPVPVINSLCAADCPAEALRAAFHRARALGQLLVVSELNLFDSGWLEGELNAALAGEAAAGFHLFATINPPTAGFRGRHRLSPALLGRFRRLVVADYSRQALCSITARALASAGCDPGPLADQLTNWHCRLCQLMARRGLVLRPASQELVQLALACARDRRQDPGLLFASHYSMHLAAAAVDRADLAAAAPAEPASDKTPDRALTEWVNGCHWALRPVTVWRGSDDSFDARTGCLVVGAALTDSQARDKVQSQVLQARWIQDTGLALSPPDATWLEGLLYRLWQQYWCQNLLSLEPDAGQWLFPLSPAQQKALALNQPRIQGLQALCRPWPQQAGQWQQRWQQIQQMSRHPSAALPASGPGTAGLPAARAAGPGALSGPLVPFGQGPGVSAVSWQLDRVTDERRRPPPLVVPLGTFGPAYQDRLLRLAVLDPVFVGGNLLVQPRPPGRQGFEAVLAGQMQPDERPCLGSHQYYGIHRLHDNSARWQPLPGWHPGERLLLVRTRPPRDLSVLRDCETGLHYLLLNGGRRQRPVEVHYVLEAPAPRQPMAAEPGGRAPHPDALCDTALYAALDARLASARKSCSSPATARALDALLAASSIEDRLKAASHYCAGFGCDRAPAAGEDLLTFLLRERQGSCRHRACLLVLLCRRWGIAARLVQGQSHLFVEASLDQGASWERLDPGGAPVRMPPMAARLCQAHAAAWSSGQRVEGGSVQQFLRSLAADERACLARKLGLRPAVVEQVAATGVVASWREAVLLREDDMLSRLLWSPDVEGFVLGCRFLRASDSPSADIWNLLGSQQTCCSPLAWGAVGLCQQSRAAQLRVRQELVVLQAFAARHHQQERWASVTYELLDKLAPASVVRASAAPLNLEEQMVCWLLERDWCVLDPAAYRSCDEDMRRLLQQLADFDFCRQLARQRLQDWYRHWLGMALPAGISSETRLAPAGHMAFEQWQPSCYGGSLPMLEKMLSGRATRPAWTDQPEGVPDLERLLNQLPPFPTRRSVTSRNSSLLVVGALPDMDDRTQASMTGILRCIFAGKELYTCVRPCCQTMLQWAFCQCLYNTVRQHGGRIHAQVPYGAGRREGRYVSGLQPISSAAQLTHLLRGFSQDKLRPLSFFAPQPDRVRAAWGEPDGLVLDGYRLASLMREFVRTVQSEALLQDLASGATPLVPDETPASP